MTVDRVEYTLYDHFLPEEGYLWNSLANAYNTSTHRKGSKKGRSSLSPYQLSGTPADDLMVLGACIDTSLLSARSSPTRVVIKGRGG